MAQAKILVDTNSYLRLAKSIHPLLFVEFGKPCYCLYVLPELNIELSRNPRFQTKFAWAFEQEYSDNRRRHLQVSRRQKTDIKDATSYIWSHVQTNSLGASRVDVLHLAYAYVLNLPVVTDDKGLRSAGSDFGIGTWGSIELLSTMVDAGHISIDKVNELVQFWRYWQDSPGNIIDEYRRLFGVDPP